MPALLLIARCPSESSERLNDSHLTYTKLPKRPRWVSRPTYYSRVVRPGFERPDPANEAFPIPAEGTFYTGGSHERMSIHHPGVGLNGVPGASDSGMIDSANGSPKGISTETLAEIEEKLWISVLRICPQRKPFSILVKSWPWGLRPSSKPDSKQIWCQQALLSSGELH